MTTIQLPVRLALGLAVAADNAPRNNRNEITDGWGLAAVAGLADRVRAASLRFTAHDTLTPLQVRNAVAPIARALWNRDADGVMHVAPGDVHAVAGAAAYAVLIDMPTTRPEMWSHRKNAARVLAGLSPKVRRG